MLKAGEGDYRWWDSWMASLTWWTWVWASFGSWWGTGRSSVLQSMGLQRIGHYWVTELTEKKKRTSLMAQTVKNLLAMQETLETWVWSLGGEDSPGGRNGNPLQYSCLENPMDRVHGCSPWGCKEWDMTEVTEHTKWKKTLGMLGPAHCSLYHLRSQEREREKLILFSFLLKHIHTPMSKCFW